MFLLDLPAFQLHRVASTCLAKVIGLGEWDWVSCWLVANWIPTLLYFFTLDLGVGWWYLWFACMHLCGFVIIVQGKTKSYDGTGMDGWIAHDLMIDWAS